MMMMMMMIANMLKRLGTICRAASDGSKEHAIMCGTLPVITVKLYPNMTSLLYLVSDCGVCVCNMFVCIVNAFGF